MPPAAGSLADAGSPAADSGIDSRYRAAADLLDGYVHESRFLRSDQSPDHRIVWASDGFAAIFGCTVEQYNQREIWGGFYHPEDAAAAVQRARRLRQGETVESELRLLRANGDVRWMYVKNKPIFDPLTGEVVGVLGVGQDITRRRIAEQERRKSESILNSVTRSDPDWLLLLDANLRVVFLNRPLPVAAPRVDIGDELIGIFSAPDWASVLTAFRDVLAGGPVTAVEVRMEWEGDRGRCFDVRIAPVREEEHTTGLAVRLVDITDRQTIQDSLRTHSVVLEKMREGVVLYDQAGTISYMNGAGRRMFRLSEDLTVFGNIAQFGIASLAAGELRTGTIEAPCLRGDRSEFLARLDFSDVELREKPMRVAVVQDYTEQKQLEREIIEIANREQQRIAVDLHDGLGQELTGAALMLRSLADRSSNPNLDDAKRLEELIVVVNRAIRGVRTIAQGLSPVELERSDLGDALATLVTRTGEKHALRVEYQAQPPRAPKIPPDVTNHLYRIGQEALFNAVRHGGAKHLRIGLAFDTRELVLTVDDDGVGFSGDDVRTKGMGLRIMRYRARMIGATIVVQRRSSGGTTVCCRWPRG